MFPVSTSGKNFKTKATKNELRTNLKSSAFCLSVLLLWTLGIKQMMHVSLIVVMLVLADAGDTTEEQEEQEPTLPVWRVDYDEYEDYYDSTVLAPPHFNSVNQLVQVEVEETAVLECAVANIDTSVTVRLQYRTE